MTFHAFLTEMVSLNANFRQTMGPKQMKMGSNSVLFLGLAADTKF